VKVLIHFNANIFQNTYVEGTGYCNKLLHELFVNNVLMHDKRLRTVLTHNFWKRHIFGRGELIKSIVCFWRFHQDHTQNTNFRCSWWFFVGNFYRHETFLTNLYMRWCVALAVYLSAHMDQTDIKSSAY